MTMPMSMDGAMMPQFSGMRMDSHASCATGMPYHAASACHSGSEQRTYIHEAISAAKSARSEQTITVAMAQRVERRPLNRR